MISWWTPDKNWPFHFKNQKEKMLYSLTFPFNNHIQQLLSIFAYCIKIESWIIVTKLYGIVQVY